jgi:hypothetical protein
MNRFLSLALAVVCLSSWAYADNDHDHDHGRVDYVKPQYSGYHPAIQAELIKNPAWQAFTDQNGSWHVQFNEFNGLPHRAMGAPIMSSGTSVAERALNFVGTHFGEYKLPVSELVLTSEVDAPNFHYANFRQEHKGMEIIDSRLVVKMTKQGEVIMFGMDIHPKIALKDGDLISLEAAKQEAQKDLHDVISVEGQEELYILPIPDHRKYDYRRVYKIYVHTEEANELPGNYETYVDANTGELLYRFNKVNATGILVDGEVSLGQLPSTPALKGLPYMDVTVGSTNYQTDIDGYIDASVSSATSATVYLKGDWSTVYSGGSTPSFTTTINAGDTIINTDDDFILEEKSAYYHVNMIHDFMKSFWPTFSGLDWSMVTNVELTSGSCNAFYNGTSVNFYTQGGGCYSLALLPDVVYHEYGHGITYEFYDDQGAVWNNGALGEGYSDVWALGLTQSAVLGMGWQIGLPNSYVRRYDMNYKVYPQDLVGQVHADGEIIAGAWWRVQENFGSIDDMMDLFTETWYGTPMEPNGMEGVLYTDILIEALQVDDAVANGGDNDITNGTPNDSLIMDAFAQHGITLLTSADMDHIPVLSAPHSTPITINTQVDIPIPWALDDAVLLYDINDSGTWTETPLTNSTGITYTADIPGQAVGTVIAYYVGLKDSNGNLTNVIPAGANEPDPNLPYFILVGFDQEHIEDFDTQQGIWTIGVAGDNNTTGTWIIDLPVPSYGDPGPPPDPATILQTGEQHTPGGIACAITGNGTSSAAGLGENDVDGGKTTLETPAFDMSGYNDPVITYWRWFSNAHANSANPGQDFWQVYISNDGTNWLNVEKTRTQDISWRRNAVIVSDYVTPNATVYLRFEASDSVRLGQQLDGGSLVEGAIDDLVIWESQTIGIQEYEMGEMDIFPNPTTDHLTVLVTTEKAEDYELVMMDLGGKMIGIDRSGRLDIGENRIDLNFNLSSGIYLVKLRYGNKEVTERVSVQ